MTLLRTGIPTARNVDHIAYTVPDLDEAVAFFGEVLGAPELYRQGPVADAGDFMAVQLDVHPRASCFVSLLRFGPECNLELFEYTAPGQRTRQPRQADVGGHHLALTVDDVPAALAGLAARAGVEVLSEPAPRPGRGGLGCHALTPWGMHIELVQPDRADRGTALYLPDTVWDTGPGGLPGVRSLHHVGYTVPDLDAAVAFCTGPLGGEVVWRQAHRPDPVVAGRNLAGDGCSLVDLAMIRLGPVTNVQLAQYVNVPDRVTTLPANSDVGGHHLAFYVDDLDRAAEYLHRVPGVRVLGTPQLVDEGGPIDGDRWVYFRAPWGMQMEALQLPEQLPYEQATAHRRFGPGPGWLHR
ncbi:VOC family protein [Catellatospora citrea]|uniref:VOC family protein n=1 Tax=Catellatospora citrea TaxID=53366 RepID=UPI0033F84B33